MARQTQPSDGGMIDYNNIPLCPSLRDLTIGGKVQSIGWLHPPNFFIQTIRRRNKNGKERIVQATIQADRLR